MTFLTKDLSEVKILLKKQFGITVTKNLESEFVFLHKRIFSASNLVYQIIQHDSERMQFLEELRSDLVHLLLLISLGLNKPLSLAMRGCIEDIIRHIYYKDHPVELELLNNTGDTKITVTGTFDYLHTHPLFEKYAGFDHVYDYIKNQYGILSKQIHGSSIHHFQLSKSISEIKLSEKQFQKLSREIGKLIDYIITIIVIFHKSEFDKIHYEHKNLTFASISPTNKKIIHKI